MNKKVLTLVLSFAFAKAIFLSGPLVAQIPADLQHIGLPAITQEDAPSNNEVYRVQTATYKADSTGYEPAMLEVLNYNEDGLKFQDYRQIFGSYASETFDEFFYTGKRLDSIVRKTSAGGFDALIRFEHDTQGRIIKETATGHYTNYTTTFEYEDDLLVEAVLTPKKGDKIMAFFYYGGIDNRLISVTEETYAPDGKMTKLYTVYYHEGKPFARLTKDRPLIHVLDFTGFYKIRSSKSGYETVKILRKAVEISQDELFRVRRELAKDEIMIEQYSTSTDARTNDWTKRHKTFKNFGKLDDRFIFRKLYYPDSTTSGSTEFDILFQRRVPKIKK
ncbi:hypothetical protein BST97_05810 [Nonlabens spongiae]|uniref:YARHG domain-containing protein n=1 Tax=Nonlabens spongiae TaxID=331648 RepID=A0A1W6MIW8_9FLAO|nr:hypothetical protein [Nonlabens spongiae]ARN77540.1 hypothetical protein BST97_05810 [Nonlabens spongiae]